MCLTIQMLVLNTRSIMALFSTLLEKIDAWVHQKTLDQLAWARQNPGITYDRYQKMLQQYNNIYGSKSKIHN
ncbi:hypothetical protein UFOVP116_243 [uncultured Caudovirales phage]|uniref:Uncharacterized protein n=1 Tax=uncultured Caudovirales phage TaxID=2100421 RepID=A0A6J5LAI2_9CAUD|nr:hypothetical protein UFOVP116_243 [uncultured Caudovirales phage]